jgi:ABC-type glycerol-3-phosphate transport system substrate-binding protein
MKKLLVMVLTVGLLSVNASVVLSQDQVVITFETSVYVEEPHKNAIDALVETYNQKNPNVKIEIYGAGYADFWNNLTTEVMAGNEADIVQVYTENIATYNALRPGGAFVELDSFMEGTDLAENLVAQEFCVVDGKTLALSNYAWGTTGIFYRKSMFEAAGIDPASLKTWDDFVAASAKLTTGNQAAMGILASSHAFVISEYNRLLGRVVSNGLYFPDGESGPYTADRIQTNNEANVWAAKQWQEYLKNYGKPVPDKKDSRELFWNGHVAINFDGPWFIGMSASKDEAVVNDIGLIPQPAVVYNGNTYKPNPSVYPLVAMISKKSKHPEEAWKFLEWMAGEEAQALIAQCGMIPSNKTYASSESYTSSYQMGGLFNEFLANNYATPVSDPQIPQLGELTQIMIDAAQEMFVSGADVQATLDDAAERLKDVMNR